MLKTAPVEQIVDTLMAPLIVWPSQWADSLPDWMREEARMQRLLCSLQEDDGMATDIEAMIYMYPATMDAPLSHEWVEIYMYLGTKVMQGRLTGSPSVVPDDIKVDTLPPYLQEQLDRLKRWIREQQSKVLATRRREERRQAKQAELEVVSKQLTLFDFGGGNGHCRQV